MFIIQLSLNRCRPAFFFQRAGSTITVTWENQPTKDVTGRWCFGFQPLFFRVKLQMMKRQTLNWTVSQKSTLPVLEIDGASVHRIRKRILWRSWGWEAQRINGQHLATRKAKKFFVWMNVWLNLSLFGGWCIFFMFIPFLREDYPQLTVIFFGWVGSTTNFRSVFWCRKFDSSSNCFSTIYKWMAISFQECFNWMIRFPKCWETWGIHWEVVGNHPNISKH